MNNIITLAIIDANGFKEINDHFGHAAGDEALKKLSKAIKDCIRKDDYLIRYGGDEFIIFRSVQHYSYCTPFLFFIFVDDDVQLSVSIGGMYNINNIDEVLAYADKLMYQGKKKHKKLL
mgnify:FL=1